MGIQYEPSLSLLTAIFSLPILCYVLQPVSLSLPSLWFIRCQSWRTFTREKNDGERRKRGKVHGILNASSKICFLVVNGQSFLVTDGSLLNLFFPLFPLLSP